MKYEIEVGGLKKLFDIEKREKNYAITVDGETTFVSTHDVGNAIHLLIDGKSFDVGAVDHKDHWEVGINGERHLINVIDPRKKSLRMASGEGDGLLISKMPGRVVEVCVESGQKVSKGDVVIIVEAMKMENPLKATKDGLVTEVFVSGGDLVEAKQKLLIIE